MPNFSKFPRPLCHNNLGACQQRCGGGENASTRGHIVQILCIFIAPSARASGCSLRQLICVTGNEFFHLVSTLFPLVSVELRIGCTRCSCTWKYVIGLGLVTPQMPPRLRRWSDVDRSPPASHPCFAISFTSQPRDDQAHTSLHGYTKQICTRDNDFVLSWSIIHHRHRLLRDYREIAGPGVGV